MFCTFWCVKRIKHFWRLLCEQNRMSRQQHILWSTIYIYIYIYIYRNPPRIIRVFISQNQTLKYRCELYTNTIFRNFFRSPKCYFSSSIFKCHIADIHQYRLHHLIHRYNHCEVIISKKHSNDCIYISVLIHDHKDGITTIRLV